MALTITTDSTEVRVGVTGTLLTAPVGTTVPTTTAGGWPTGWLPLGSISEDGPAMTPGMEITEIKEWQSLYTIRRIVNGRSLEWKFRLQQWNATTFELAFGGGTLTETSPGSGIFTYAPPAASFIDERMIGLEVQDGSIVHRYWLTRALVTNVADIVFNRTDAAGLELTVAALGSGSTQPWAAVFADAAMGHAS
jgi:hypothetical protein